MVVYFELSNSLLVVFQIMLIVVFQKGNSMIHNL